MRLRLSFAAALLALTGALLVASPVAAQTGAPQTLFGDALGSITNSTPSGPLVDSSFGCIGSITTVASTDLTGRSNGAVNGAAGTFKTALSPQTVSPPSCSTSSLPIQYGSVVAPPSPPQTIVNTTSVPDAAIDVSTSGYGCGSALAYLASHAAPGFRFVCPGYALGHEAMTCENYASVCPGDRVIIINDPCPVAYMNEASNSWVVEDLSTVPFDPYGRGCPE